MSSGIEPFDVLPSKITILDHFNGSALSPIWGTPVTHGTVFTKMASYMKAVHGVGAGTGISSYPISQRFGAQMSFECDLSITTFDAACTNMIAGMRLWLNDDNWFILGAEINTSNQSAAMLRYKIDGAESVAHFLTEGHDVTRSPLDTLWRRFRIDMLNNHVVVYVNGIKRYDIPTSSTIDMLNYYFELVAGTTDDTKASEVRFATVSYRHGIEAPSSYPARIAGKVTLSNTTPSEIVFSDIISGDFYELTLSADLDEAYMPMAFTVDAPATYTDITAACNDLTTALVTLLPAIPAANDAAFFGALEKFDKIDVYMDGGVSNLDNVYAAYYWNGGSWAAIAITDGTNGGTAGRTFYENGRITFSPPADWATVAVNGVTGYYIKLQVNTPGVSVPIATHIQLGFVSSSGFDHAAAFLSSIDIGLKRNMSGYERFYNDFMTYRQCVGERNVDINGWRCDGEVKVIFKLSETPAKPVIINYTGFTRRL